MRLLNHFGAPRLFFLNQSSIASVITAVALMFSVKGPLVVEVIQNRSEINQIRNNVTYCTLNYGINKQVCHSITRSVGVVPCKLNLSFQSTLVKDFKYVKLFVQPSHQVGLAAEMNRKREISYLFYTSRFSDFLTTNIVTFSKSSN